MSLSLDKVSMNEPLRVVALRDANSDFLMRASSGGAFSLLARHILNNGGVVFGSELLEGGVVRHVMVDSVTELPRLQGSKYVQSDTGQTFRECEELLSTGRSVLYSGTPCQIFALRSYLDSHGIKDDNLFTIDLICHGVTSPSLFRLYIKWLEEKVDAVPGSLRYYFRSKKRGWGLYYYHYYYISKRSGKTLHRFGPGGEDPYYAAFIEGRLCRKSCYSCQFSGKRRAGDFTIGDYWGIERSHPGFECKQGASVMLINTPKGMAFFTEECDKDCFFEESNFELASRENHNLVEKTSRSAEDEVLAKKVDEAVRRGEGDRVFGELLRRPFSIKCLLMKILPPQLIYSAKRLING